jgi:hypothetical protein
MTGSRVIMGDAVNGGAISVPGRTTTAAILAATAGLTDLHVDHVEVFHARRCVTRCARRPLRGARGASHRRTDGRDHQPAGHVHLRIRPVAVPRHQVFPEPHIVSERGVGTQEAMEQAIRATRPGGSVGYVGVPHGVALDGADLFFRHVRLLGGPAPVRRYLPELIGLVFNGKINPGKVFDLTLPLDQVAEGYRAMDERRAIKTLLRPS